MCDAGDDVMCAPPPPMTDGHGFLNERQVRASKQTQPAADNLLSHSVT